MKGAGVIFSVVVPAHNGGDLLRACLKSLAALDFPKDRYEVIVVDNNSTDATPAIIAEFPFRKIEERAVQSSYAARNAALPHAKGRIIAFTDSDCEVDPQWLARLQDAAERNPRAGCIAGEILAFPPSTLVERYSERIGLLRQRGPLSGWHFKPYAQTANAAFRREVFEAIGGFDASVKSGGDATIAWRMLDETDYELVFAPEAIVYHHHRTDVAALWSQFRRYGGGKIGWAKAQPGYSPPKVRDQEQELVAQVEALIAKLAARDVSEEEIVFPLLSLATKSAHLSGYLQEMLARLSETDDPSAWPALAARRTPHAEAPACAICGGREFEPGPNNRLQNGRKPRCVQCGSLERHRIARDIAPLIANRQGRELRCLSLAERIPKLEALAAVTFAPGFTPAVRGPFDMILDLRSQSATSDLTFEAQLAYCADRLASCGVAMLGPFAPAAHGASDPSGVRLGADAGWRVARALPEHAVLVARPKDAVTGARFMCVLFSADPQVLAKAAQDLERRDAAPAFVAC